MTRMYLGSVRNDDGTRGEKLYRDCTPEEEAIIAAQKQKENDALSLYENDLPSLVLAMNEIKSQMKPIQDQLYTMEWDLVFLRHIKNIIDHKNGDRVELMGG